jgi:hypothetical protein
MTNATPLVDLSIDVDFPQSRGGCACAAPYAHRLLNISPSRAEDYRDAVLNGFEAVKPGWTRLNFSYFIEAAEFEFLLDAIEFIAEHGERFIPEYEFDWQSGAWPHRHDVAQPDMLTLAIQPTTLRQSQPMTFRDCIKRAHELLAALPTMPSGRSLPQDLPAKLVVFGY